MDLPLDIDAGLTDEMKEVRQTIHRFALEVMRPAAAELDAMADPSDTIAPDSILWDCFTKYKTLGIGDPSRYGDDLTSYTPLRETAIVTWEPGR